MKEIVDDPLSLLFSNVFIRLIGILNTGSVMLKLEGFSITGSIKIKTAKFMIADLEARGIARPGKTTLVESSSGNLGVALSVVCRCRGYRFICVTDPNIYKSKLRAMTGYATDVVRTEQRDINSGDLDSRLA